MLAIPVMAGSTSYALSEARGQKEGLDLTPKQGRYFYGVIAASMLIGLALNFTGVNPIKALVFAAVFNGIIAVRSSGSSGGSPPTAAPWARPAAAGYPARSCC